MRVVFTDNVADDPCRLDRLGAGHQTEFAHGEQHAALDGLLAVLYVRQGAALDDGDGVLKVVARCGFVQQDAVAVVVRRNGDIDGWRRWG